jgi:cardiolipin synthase
VAAPPSSLTALRARAAFPPPDPEPTRILADQALSRAAGAPLVPGNAVRLLRDAAENYPAWLDAIARAGRRIHFESYIIHDDAWGRRFREALADAARRGVRVRLLYDWLGALGAARRAFWRPLVEAGAEVRCFNPPGLDRPFGWLTRDHRKALVVDGTVAFVSGLCVGQAWAGDPARGVEPWRDTGVEVRGPAVADVERAFARAWAAAGAPLPDDDRGGAEEIAPEGDVALRVIASEPRTAGLLRLDQLVAGIARETLWLTDAYFVGLTSYVQALVAAARDGVDVRLLVPGAGDIPWLRPLSRAGYRPLLQAGVRVFEWNGPMLHAKSAVADGRWARVGSSNLNIASWLGNWELDVAVDDEGFASEMAAMYEDDLARATEIVLDARNRVQPTRPRERRRRPRPRGRARGGSAGRATAGALRIGNTVGAALTARRVLGPAEARVMAGAGLLLLLVALAAALRPEVIAYPLAALAAWGAVSLLVRAARLKGRGARDEGRVN